MWLTTTIAWAAYPHAAHVGSELLTLIDNQYCYLWFFERKRLFNKQNIKVFVLT